MKDALLLVDVINDFRHEDGEKLLASFWDGDGPGPVQRAIAGGGGELVRQIAPTEEDKMPA